MGTRLCIFGVFSFDGELPHYVVTHLGAIRKEGFIIHATCTSRLSPGAERTLQASVDRLIFRRNENFDIGGWSEALFGVQLDELDILFITNDSVYPLVSSLSAFLNQLLKAEADMYGAVMSHEVAPHLQSWLLVLRRSALENERIRSILSTPILGSLDRMDLIERFEVGLSGAAREVGLRLHAQVDWPKSEFSISTEVNPSHHLWSELVQQKNVPYIKVDTLTKNPHHVSLRPLYKIIHQLDPAIRIEIQDDLRRRGSIDQSFTSRMRASRDEANHQFWPELHPFVRACWAVRDQALLVRLLAYSAYRLERTVSRFIRQRLLGGARRG